MADTVTTEFLDAFADAWNRHDVDAIVSMMTEDCVMCLSAGPTKEGAKFEGHDEIRAGAKAVFERMPDVQWLDAHHLIAGDRGMTQWVLVATAPDGAKIETNGCDIFRFRDGLIALKDTYRKSPA